MAPQLRPEERGFTLVEVMVALVIMAVLAVLAWQGVDGIVRARDASNVRLEQTLRLGTILTQWDQDLAALQESTAVPLAITFDGASMRVVRRTDRGLQVVVWSLKPGLDSSVPGSTLMRWASPIAASTGELQDSWFRSLQLQGTETAQIRAIPGVAEWQVYCYRVNAWSNCQSSNDVTPVQQGQSAPPRTVDLPRGIRMVLTFAPGSGATGTLTRDIRLGPQWPG